VDIVFSRQARRDLQSLKAYITQEAYSSRATAYVSRILDCCESLATFPLRGTSRDDLLPGLRTIVFEGRVTIAFTVKQDRVIVQGVFYAGRAWESQLEKD